MKYLLTFVLGMVAYFIIVGLTAEQLTSYAGIDKMGQLPLSEIPLRISQAYTSFIEYFITNDYFNHYIWQGIAFAIAICISICFLIFWIFKTNKNISILNTIIGFFCVLVLPLASFIIYIMANEFVHSLMVYGSIGTLIFLVLILDNSITLIQEKPMLFKKSISIIWQCCVFFMVVLLFSFVFRYVILSNASYVKLDITLENAYAEGVALTTRIESIDGYDGDELVLFIGSYNSDLEARELDFLDEAMFNNLLNTDQSKLVNKDHFLKRFIGFENDTYFTTKPNLWLEINSWLISSSKRRIINEMPLYPYSGSILKINDKLIVVKFEYFDDKGV